MSAWTTEAILNALGCIEGVEWTVAPGGATWTCDAAGLRVYASPTYIAATIYGPGREHIEMVSRAHGDSDYRAEIEATLRALRAAVVALHGPEAWPWSMRGDTP